MSEEDLELLITLDDPWDGHEDTFSHLQAENTVACGGGQPFPTKRQDERTEVIIDNDSSKLAG